MKRKNMNSKFLKVLFYSAIYILGLLNLFFSIIDAFNNMYSRATYELLFGAIIASSAGNFLFEELEK